MRFRNISVVASLIVIMLTVDLQAQSRPQTTDEYRVARMITRMLCITGADGTEIEGTGILAFQDVMKRETLNAGLPDDNSSFNVWWEEHYSKIVCGQDTRLNSLGGSASLSLLAHIIYSQPYNDFSKYDAFFKGDMNLNINVKDGISGQTIVDWLEEMETKAAANVSLEEAKYYREVREYFVENYGAESGS